METSQKRLPIEATSTCPPILKARAECIVRVPLTYDISEMRRSLDSTSKEIFQCNTHARESLRRRYKAKCTDATARCSSNRKLRARNTRVGKVLIRAPVSCTGVLHRGRWTPRFMQENKHCVLTEASETVSLLRLARSEMNAFFDRWLRICCRRVGFLSLHRIKISYAPPKLGCR